ncbi:MAG: hypothetical protein R2712_03380 [Vicinamibacterales bacterium]
MRQFVSIVAACAVIGLATPAAAQDTSRAEVTAGGRYYHVTLATIPSSIYIDRPNDFPEGWYADIAFNLSPKFAVVGDVGGTSFHDEDNRSSSNVTTRETLDVRIYTFMGGIRIRAPQRRAFVPFGQILFGAEHDSYTYNRTVQFLQNPPNVQDRESASSNPVLALESGVTIMAGPVGIRATGGSVRFFKQANADAFRFSLGAGFRF